MSDDSTTMRTAGHDWSRADAMADEAVRAAALRDPDAQPLSAASIGGLRPVPRTRTMRRALGLTQERFAVRFHIPIGTLRDWEQGRSEPDQTAHACLTVSGRDPNGVRRALDAGQGGRQRLVVEVGWLGDCWWFANCPVLESAIADFS